VQTAVPPSTETYTHRIGRTARAGREGVCITLYTKMTEGLIQRITKQAKIHFKKIGAPQTQDIIDSNLRDIKHSITNLDGSVKSLFDQPAKQLVETLGAEEAVARLLALVSGHTEKLKSRSVLCGAEGFITYIVKTTKEFNNLGYIWGIMKKVVNEKITTNFRGMKQFKTRDGAVFDILEEHCSEFEECVYNDRYYGHNYTIERATSSIPETIDPADAYRARERERGGDSSHHHSSHSNGHRNGHDSRNGHGHHSSRSVDHRRKDRANRKDIFVGNISFDTTKDDILNLCSKNDIKGDIEVRIAQDNETGKSKGFGFVSVYEDDLFEKVLKLQGKKIHDRVLRINAANKDK